MAMSAAKMTRGHVPARIAPATSTTESDPPTALARKAWNAGSSARRRAPMGGIGGSFAVAVFIARVPDPRISRENLSLNSAAAVKD
jgi:hypothetical protein